MSSSVQSPSVSCVMLGTKPVPCGSTPPANRVSGSDGAEDIPAGVALGAMGNGLDEIGAAIVHGFAAQARAADRPSRKNSSFQNPTDRRMRNRIVGSCGGARPETFGKRPEIGVEILDVRDRHSGETRIGKSRIIVLTLGRNAADQGVRQIDGASTCRCRRPDPAKCWAAERCRTVRRAPCRPQASADRIVQGSRGRTSNRPPRRPACRGPHLPLGEIADRWARTADEPR